MCGLGGQSLLIDNSIRELLLLFRAVGEREEAGTIPATT